MKKKVLSVVLGMTMIMTSLLTGCGNDAQTPNSGAESQASAETQANAEQTGEIETVNVTYFSFGNFTDNAMVEEAVNAISEKEIGVRAKLNVMEGGQFMSQQSMLLSGSEDIDLIVTPLVTDAMNSGAFADMTELLDQYGQGIKEVLGENVAAGMYHGCLYGLPNMHEYAQTPLIVYNADMAEKLGLDMSSVKTLADMDSILAKVKEAYPNMSTPLYTSNSTGPLSASFGYWDCAGAKGENLGVIMYDGEADKIVNLYETEEYRDLVATLHDFSQKGYLNKDAAVLNDGYSQLTGNDMSFADVISQHELIGEEYTPTAGVELKIIPLGDAWKTTAYTTSFMWRIMSTSEKQEAAMKFLNLLYTNAEVEDLICNGIEGKHYQVLENGKYDFLDGIDIANSTYNPNLGWVMPNGWLAAEWNNAIDGYSEKMAAYNERAKVSPAFGFVFDSANVANEVTACNNVVQQYCNSVEENGERDVDEAIAELNQALKDAGIDAIIAEKQKQYDEFLANK